MIEADIAPRALAAVFTRLACQVPRASGEEPDYTLGLSVRGSFAGFSRNGHPSLVIPLQRVPDAIARSVGGCFLRPAGAVDFDFDNHQWTQPAAALECTDPQLVDIFCVLACDVAARMASLPDAPEWSDVIAVVEQWQALLAIRRRLSPEGEIGLWGELWFILRSRDPGQVVRAWLGPEASPVDFLNDATAVEVKTSTTRLTHWVSQTQLNEPAGELPAYFFSLWVAVDPSVGTTLTSLASDLLSKVSDPADALRRLLLAGYSPSDRLEYTRALSPLAEPMWFSAEAVPRVREADHGVLRLRYLVELDEGRRLSRSEEQSVADRFGHPSSQPE